MPVPPSEIIKNHPVDLDSVERFGTRNLKNVLEIVEPDPTWPRQFEEIKSRIQAALGDTAVAIAHAGSTSVPDLPAKDMIDIDLTVKDINDEASYVGPLEEAGFIFLLRERNWHEHRLFGLGRDPTPVNIHVWGPDSPEVERHRIFREWLIKTPADKERYAQAKREAAMQTNQAGETVQEYTNRKQEVLLDILDNAFRDLGYIE